MLNLLNFERTASTHHLNALTKGYSVILALDKMVFNKVQKINCFKIEEVSHPPFFSGAVKAMVIQNFFFHFSVSGANS